MKAHKIFIHFVRVAGVYLLLNLIPVEGLAHAPEFHLPKETVETQETENHIEDHEQTLPAQNTNFPEKETQESNVTSQSEAIDNSIKTQPNNILSESLAILVIINPLILYFIRNKLLGIGYS